MISRLFILEHHMAARRMGFHQMFEPLYEIERFRTGLLDGSLPASFFSPVYCHFSKPRNPEINLRSLPLCEANLRCLTRLFLE